MFSTNNKEKLKENSQIFQQFFYLFIPFEIRLCEIILMQ